MCIKINGLMMVIFCMVNDNLLVLYSEIIDKRYNMKKRLTTSTH
jgi:hypothetical protein